ncbi:ATP-binding protein [Streptomyces sp. NPDC046866]|uniref:ATP-binding protein n=1 Tax=Streptomyces sp. NPDC046866 TaxID=3154921 RepID=UPI0034534173
MLIVVSELVSNAHRHGQGLTRFDVTVRPGQVVVEVSDRSPHPPQLRRPSVHTPGGFGWRVITTLAPTTHIHTHPHGKTITAALPVPAPRPPAPWPTPEGGHRTSRPPPGGG